MLARCALSLALALGCASAQSPQQAAIQLSATVASNPAAITFTWLPDGNATSYEVARRLAGSTTWGPPTPIPGGASATTWTDSNVQVGTRYEYWFSKTGNPNGRGFIQSGIAIPAVHDRGAVILFVDAAQIPSLGSRLDRLVTDLVGDGWTVLRHDVQTGTSIASIKALVIAEAIANGNALKAVFLLGHLPVPYSGNIDPDTHLDHQGAWPADLYYGERHGPWTDTTVNTTTAARSANWNVPGDGRFDQSRLPSDVDFAVGRVDLANLPMFAASESALLQQYLDKNHQYRHKIIAPNPRAVVDDNFGAIFDDFPAASGWRSFAPLVGAANVTAGDYFTALGDVAGNGYQFSYGCGPGSYTSSQGIGSTANFTVSPNRGVFTLLFGSYFGDWDTTDNFLRAPLASGWTLASMWAGRPQWSLHPLGLGETIGTCAKTTQNDLAIAGLPTGRSVHAALMGDPTLRQHVVAPSLGVAIIDQWPQAVVTWNASGDVHSGYFIYRASDPLGPFTLLNSTPLASTLFLDPSPPAGPTTYMVRAARLETTPSGTYWNLSQGDFATTFLPQTAAAHNSFGAGCYTIGDSLYQRFATPAAANAALAGTALVLTPNGSSYVASRANAAFVLPTGTATSLLLGDDDVATVPLAQPLAFPGGTTSALQVYSNGIVASAPLAMTLAQSATPDLGAMLGEIAAAWYAWHDFDPSEVGSGAISSEQIGSVHYVTWNSVESAPAGSNPSTLQFQFDLATGVVRIVCANLATTGSDPFLFGWSPGGASLDAGPTDLVNGLPLSIPASNSLPLQLSASPPPVSTPSAGTLITYTAEQVPEAAPGSGVRFGVVIIGLAAIPFGLPLSFANMPGCSLYVDQQVTTVAFIGFSSSLACQFVLPAGVPIGAEFHAQAAALVLPNSLPNGQNAFGAVTSNGIGSFVSVH